MILVTGGTGLLGSHLLLKLVEQGEEVKALVRSNSIPEKVLSVFSYYTDKPDELFNKIDWVKGDVVDYISIYDALEGVDQVYHCAAYVSFDQRDKGKIKITNIHGTANVVNACLERGVKKLVHVSSIAAIGINDDGGSSTEKDPWPTEPSSAYTASKAEAELEVWRGITEGLDAVIVNPSVILGPGFWHSGSSAFFSRIRKGLSFYTKGSTGFVDVRDVVDVMIQLMRNGVSAERYIVSAENLSYEKLFKSISLTFGMNTSWKYVSPVLTGIAWRFSKLASLFGVRQLITRESAKIAHKKLEFSSGKVISELKFKFRKIEQSIKEICLLYESSQE